MAKQKTKKSRANRIARQKLRAWKEIVGPARIGYKSNHRGGKGKIIRPTK
jgi:hypothetical protein